MAKNLGIEQIVVDRLINKYVRLLPKFMTVIRNSFLSLELQDKYVDFLNKKIERIIKEI